MGGLRSYFYIPFIWNQLFIIIDYLNVVFLMFTVLVAFVMRLRAKILHEQMFVEKCNKIRHKNIKTLHVECESKRRELKIYENFAMK